MVDLSEEVLDISEELLDLPDELLDLPDLPDEFLEEPDNELGIYIMMYIIIKVLNIIMRYNTIMLKVLIDTRETGIINSLKSRELGCYADKLSIDVLQLDIGDIHISFQDKLWIFERKTVADLLASIKDGRYKEQKTRLLASGHNITYIIEGGDILSNKQDKQRELLSSIYFYTMYRDNINLVFTKDVEETSTYISTLTSKMIDKPEKFMSGKGTSEYVDCIKMKKISNITPDTCYIMQLSQIPTISSTIAKHIERHYHTMRELIKALDESEDKVGMLCKIEKIGREKAKKILEYLKY